MDAFSIIPQVLHKIQEDEATVMTVLPLWPTQVWFPTALHLLTVAPVLIPQHSLIQNWLYFCLCREIDPFQPPLNVLLRLSLPGISEEHRPILQLDEYHSFSYFICSHYKRSTCGRSSFGRQVL